MVKATVLLMFPDSREVESNHYTLLLFSWQLLKATAIKILGYVRIWLGTTWPFEDSS